MLKPIGPTFPAELNLAGLVGLPFAWGDDGTFLFDPRMTQAQIDAVLVVYAAHDPTKSAPPSPLEVALSNIQADPTIPTSLKVFLNLLVPPKRR